MNPLCEFCIYSFANCKGNPTFLMDVVQDQRMLIQKERDCVVSCAKFEDKK